MNKVSDLTKELLSQNASKHSADVKINSERSLSVIVNRAKARWLKRVMHSPNATSTAKCLAYAISDHLNCVTLDSWPSQERLASQLGFKSQKTISRASQCLLQLDFIRVSRRPGKHISCRYAPIFVTRDLDSHVPDTGLSGPGIADTNVLQSFLTIPLISTSKAGSPADRAASPYDRNRQGAYEQQIARRLGTNGWEILQRLGELDSLILVRLCAAQANGCLRDKDLNAAKLAAEHCR